MAEKALKLKRERAKTVVRASRFTTSAKVLIDHDITHLDQPFTYGLPEDLKSEVEIGSRVLVPFKSAEREGIVLEILENQTSTSKPIMRVLNRYAYSLSALKLATEVASRYTSSIVKILRYIPEAYERDYIEKSDGRKLRVNRNFEHVSSITKTKLVEQLSTQTRAALIILPTEREAEGLFKELSERFQERCVKAFARSKRPKAFPTSAITIGTRAAIFWQIPDLSSIVIFNENSEHYWSDRSPFWNVRDVALIRSRLEDIDLHFYSGFPSMEIYRLLDLGYLNLVESSRRRFLQRRRVRSKPDSYHQSIREGLRKGVVLVQVATKDYSTQVICKTCRCRPTCECGFQLKMLNKTDFSCSACGLSTSEWKCTECGSKEKLLLSKGAQRIEEELGKAFPAIPIYMSTASKAIEEAPNSGIVIATPGMEPRNKKYSALVLLDGELQLNRPTMRAEERLLDNWFSLLQFVRDDASIFVDLSYSNRLTQALSADNPMRVAKALLSERRKVKLPPWHRIVRIQGEDLGAIQEHLRLQFKNVEVSKSSHSLEYVLRIPVEESDRVIQAIYALVKYRSASRKTLISVQIDPHDL